MKRQKLLVYALFFGFGTSLAGSLSGSKKKDEDVLEFVNLVQKRFYVIRRLEGAVERLLAQYGSLCGQGDGASRQRWVPRECLGRGCPHRECPHRRCPHRRCPHRRCSLERELFLVNASWQDCLAYKQVMNDTQVRELLVHLIVLYDALIKVSGMTVEGKTSSLTAQLLEKELEGAFAVRKKTFSCYGLNDLLDTVDTLAATSRGLSTAELHDWHFHDWEFQGQGEQSFAYNSSGEQSQIVQSQIVQSQEGAQGLLADESNYHMASANESLVVVQTDTKPVDTESVNTEPVNTELVTVELAGTEPDAALLETFIKPSEQGEFVINTTLRFYLVQRLHGVFEHLARLADGKKIACIGLYLPTVESFQSPAARACVEKMVAQDSLQPLFDCWEDVGSYRSIGDAHLIKELLLIVVQIYRLLMKALAPDQVQEEVPTEQVLDLYSVISSLPLPELFSLLDELAHESSSVVAAYQQGATQGWKSVFKQYWWVPPVVLAGCASLYWRMKRFLGKPQLRKGLAAGRSAE